MPLRLIRPWNAPTSKSEAAVSLKPPFPPLVKGVRRAAVTTMSSGFLERMLEVGLEVERCEETWERRCCAVHIVS